MNKKILIQLSLFFFVVLIASSVFYFFFLENDEKKIYTEKDDVKLKISNKSSNLIENMKYLSSDEQGNKYEITSETGEIDLQNPDIIFMNNVKAQINLANHPTIYISSNYAKYNTKNYETYFRSNVLLEYMKHSATSGNLNLSFENNLISMYEKIIYKNPEAQLAADRLEIDLLTKNSKIFMDDKSKKIKMIAKK